MKHRILSFILACSFIFALIPILATGAYAIEREDTENIALKNYIEDTVIFSQRDNTTTASSSSIDRWNRFYPSYKCDTITDPLDDTNLVGRYFAQSSSGVSKKRGFPTDEEYLWEVSFMIAEPEAGAYPSSVTVKMDTKDVVVLTRTAENLYTYTFDGNTGTVAPGTWMRFMCHAVPGETGFADASTTVRYALLGTFTDSTNGQCSSYAAVSTGAVTNSEFHLNFKLDADSTGGVYMDDVLLMQPGEFGPAQVTLQDCGDVSHNYVLDGKVTVKLYHEIDSTRFDVGEVKLFDAQKNEVPFTSLAFNPLRSDYLIFDFSEDPLSANTEYTVVLPENTVDVVGRVIKNPEITFATRGNEGEYPVQTDKVVMPEEGYVMPDMYNTGYRCEKSELVNFFEKYTKFSSGNTVVITESLARAYDYEFDHFYLENARIYVTATSPVYIHDFYVKGDGISNGKPGQATSSARLTIAWGEGEGSSGDFFGGAYMTITHCFIHDVGADHMKGGSGQIVESNYFRDGGTRNPGAHADVVQFMGSTTSIINDSRFIGNRFDIPGLGHDHVANCCFFFKPEANTVGCTNIQAVGNWFNGGGYTTYLTPANGKDKTAYIIYENNKFGYGHAFGPLAVSSFSSAEDLASTGGSYQDNGYMTTLEAGSVVFYDGDENRVFDIADIGTENGYVMVNFANYMTVQRSYRIEARVLDPEGNVVASAEKTGEIRRYTPYKEYFTAENQEIIGTFTDSAGVHNIVQLKVLPDLPHDVSDTLELTGLPANLEGCSVQVCVFDTTEGRNTYIRSSELSDTVLENTLRPEPTTWTVTFADIDGQVLKTETVVEGESATPPTVTAPVGMEHVGWEGDYTNVTASVTVTAKYSPKTYTVTFKGKDGRVIKTETVQHGMSATAPAAPYVDGFIFDSWSVSAENITENTEIVAVYTPVSAALSAYISKVADIGASKGSDYEARRSALSAAWTAWQSVTDKTEQGARDAYVTMIQEICAYNHEVSRRNEAFGLNIPTVDMH